METPGLTDFNCCMETTVSLRFTKGEAGFAFVWWFPPPFDFFFSTGLFPLLGRFLCATVSPLFEETPAPLICRLSFAETSWLCPGNAPEVWYRALSVVSITTGLSVPLTGLVLWPELSSLSVWVPQELWLSLSYCISKLNAPLALPGAFFFSLRFRFFAGASDVCLVDWLGFSGAWLLFKRNLIVRFVLIP